MEHKNMENNIIQTNDKFGDFQKLLENFSKCKIEFFTGKNECQRLKEINIKLEAELKESRDLEKSHRYHLQNSREMIGNLQETISQLVYLKRSAKMLKEEIKLKDNTIAMAKKDKETMIEKHDKSLTEIRSTYEERIEEMKIEHERKIRQAQHDSETQIAQYTCVIDELKSKLIEVETEHRDKMNMAVLEYEEKIQRSTAQVVQLQDQLSRQSARTDSNIDAYRRKLEELEEKLKQSQFKEYLAQSSYSQQYDNTVEKPYSVSRNTFSGSRSVDQNPVLESPKPLPKYTMNHRTPKTTNTLQVTYSDVKPPSTVGTKEKKGQFNITKKRKLYTAKDFQDF